MYKALIFAALALGSSSAWAAPFFSLPAKLGKARYVLAADRCDKKACTLEVQLIEGKKQRGALALEMQPGHRGKFKPVPEASETAFLAETSEENGFEVRPRAVRLRGGAQGLLVTSQYGFEHVHRTHELFVMHQGKLRRAWSGSDRGPMYSWVKLKDLDGDGGQELVFFTHVYEPEFWSDMASLIVETYRYSAGRMVERKAGAPLYAAIFSSDTTIEAAQKAESSAYCKTGRMLLRSDDFSLLKKGLFITAAIFLSKKEAQAVVRRAKKCRDAA